MVVLLLWYRLKVWQSQMCYKAREVNARSPLAEDPSLSSWMVLLEISLSSVCPYFSASASSEIALVVRMKNQ